MAPPPGLGENVFKDRGAVDRAHFIGPNAKLVNPQDNGGDDLDSQWNHGELAPQFAGRVLHPTH